MAAASTYDREMVQIGDPSITAPRERLIRLLRIGAAIEHALMVEYIYAAYSIDAFDEMASPPATPTPDQTRRRDAMLRWQQEILAIAKEEMGHLISVQNVLMLLGAPVTLARENYPWDSRLFPFEFQLEPLGRGSLACYVAAEMPEDWVTPLQADGDGMTPEDIEALRQQVLDDVKAHLTAQGQSISGLGINRVGSLFNSILSILEDREALPDSEFVDYAHDLQALHAEWGRYYPMPTPLPVGTKVKPPDVGEALVIVAPMSTRDQAIAALKMVAEQGESAKSPGETPSTEEVPPQLSHFRRFLAVYKEWRDLGVPESPANKVPVNPIEAPADPIRGGQGPVTPITDARSSRWAKLFNVRYQLLLAALACSLETPRRADTTGIPGLRGPLAHLCFGEMYNMKAIARILLRSPLAAPNDPNRAGPPFQMPYNLTLPQAQADRLRALRDMLDSSEKLAGWLSKYPDDPNETQYLTHLRAIDGETRRWLDQQITRLSIARGQE